MSDEMKNRFMMIAEEMVNEPTITNVVDNNNVMFDCFIKALNRIAKEPGFRNSFMGSYTRDVTRWSRALGEETWGLDELFDDTLNVQMNPPEHILESMDKMRMYLGLTDFTKFKNQQLRTNRDRGLRPEDLVRRTGRTTEILLNAIARCLESKASRIWIRSKTHSLDNHMIDMAQIMVSQLGLSPRPIIFSGMRTMKNIADAIVCVDHTVSETKLEVGFAL